MRLINVIIAIILVIVAVKFGVEYANGLHHFAGNVADHASNGSLISSFVDMLTGRAW